MATSDAESDHFGAFDISFSQFTEDDFARIDTDIASHFDHPAGPGAAIEHPTDNESLDFDAPLDLFNLTEEDFLEIDSAVALHLNVVTPKPQVIEASKLAPSTGTATPATKPPKVGWRYRGSSKWKAWEERSLMEKYRSWGVLSVSDLVGPVWCVESPSHRPS